MQNSHSHTKSWRKRTGRCGRDSRADGKGASDCSPGRSVSAHRARTQSDQRARCTCAPVGCSCRCAAKADRAPLIAALLFLVCLPGPEHRVVTDFSPSTDLSAFTLLNDNNFGGTSTCGLELRERVVTDEATGAQSLRYSVVFKGELHSLMPFQNDSTLRSGKREKVLPRPMPKENAPQPSLLSSQPPPVQRPSGLVSQPPKNKSSAPLSDLDEPVAATGTQQTDKSATVAESDVPAEQALPPKPPSKSFFRMPSLLQPPENGPINGFAAMIFPNFAYPELDLELFDFLAMNVRTDGRAYMFNVRCFSNTFESVDGFVYQARIREEQPRPMHKLEVRFENFMCTQHGRARSFASPLPKGRILSFGFSVTGESRGQLTTAALRAWSLVLSCDALRCVTSSSLFCFLTFADVSRR